MPLSDVEGHHVILPSAAPVAQTSGTTLPLPATDVNANATGEQERKGHRSGEIPEQDRPHHVKGTLSSGSQAAPRGDRLRKESRHSRRFPPSGRAGGNVAKEAAGARPGSLTRDGQVRGYGQGLCCKSGAEGGARCGPRVPRRPRCLSSFRSRAPAAPGGREGPPPTSEREKGATSNGRRNESLISAAAPRRLHR